MDSREYREACAALGVPPTGMRIQRLLGVCEQSAHRYANGKRDIPREVEVRLLTLLHKHKERAT